MSYPLAEVDVLLAKLEAKRVTSTITLAWLAGDPACAPLGAARDAMAAYAPARC